MTQNVPLAVGDVAVEGFFDAVQEMGSGLAVNFEVDLLNTTTVRVSASPGHGQVSLSIDGQYRFITAPITRVHPAGAAGVYDLFATATANDPIAGAPPGDDYSFALAIVPTGTLPVGVGISRLMRRLQWDGAAIVRIDRITVEPPQLFVTVDGAAVPTRAKLATFTGDRTILAGAGGGASGFAASVFPGKTLLAVISDAHWYSDAARTVEYLGQAATAPFVYRSSPVPAFGLGGFGGWETWSNSSGATVYLRVRHLVVGY